MDFLPLLGQALKSPDIIDLLNLWDLEVTYSFDRDGDDAPDQYWASAKRRGLEFIFDEEQRLKMIFIHVLARDGFDAADLRGSDLQIFPSKSEVAAHAAANSITVKEGVGRMLGTESDWIRLDSVEHSIHYEFRGGALDMITLVRPRK